ncbi:zinc-binding dehydrogenase [Gordonia hongkongensis]|uniref:Zinc-binding dehydrogenase n=1 Tax=Gordonia hongkongensis TaxID=1701090 RepID=A0AAX3T930_9ACTN|nr:zinc-binding dehydrogenase [Gordonia hongkongensis]QIK49376.1 alcohol dehydrogenase catalytic domain-containing protein [Gordonia terrae]WFP25704.1 zinc-binding dehydrogenase [Gordonia hongkongensis]
MRAAQLVSAAGEPQLVDIDIPEPGPGEVRIAVRACGVCGSDLHIIDGHIKTPYLPLTLGHEASGLIDKIGPDTRCSVDEGGRVLVNPIVVCGDCEACTDGRTNQCPNNTVLGVVGAGAAAEYVIAPAGNVHAIPDSIDFPTAAIMADAVAGPFHAIRTAGIKAGDTVAVFGLGGLGLHAVMILKQVIGARVIGVDTYKSALERARSFGADVVIDTRDEVPSRRIREETNGGVDASFEFVGRSDTVEQAFRSLRPGGLCTVVGVGTEKLHLDVTVGTLVAKEWSIRGSYGYVSRDLDDLIRLVGDRDLKIEGTISHMVSLEDYNEGIATLRDRSKNPIRVVVQIGPSR